MRNEKKNNKRSGIKIPNISANLPKKDVCFTAMAAGNTDRY